MSVGSFFKQGQSDFKQRQSEGGLNPFQEMLANFKRNVNEPVVKLASLRDLKANEPLSMALQIITTCEKEIQSSVNQFQSKQASVLGSPLSDDTPEPGFNITR